MSHGPLYIGVRETLDWSDLDLVEAKLHAHFRQKYEMWNDTFTISYADFRQHLKMIAEGNWSRMEGVQVCLLRDVPDGAWVAPVDDDDWFTPDLGSRLPAAHERATEGFHWVGYKLEAPESKRPGKPSLRRRLRRYLRARRPVPFGSTAGRRMQWTCSTNSYVLRKGVNTLPLLEDHVLASRYVDEHPDRMTKVAAGLSLQNGNLSSQTALAWREPTISKARLVAAYHRHQRLYPRIRLAPELAWAQPYVAEVGALMDQLRLRR